MGFLLFAGRILFLLGLYAMAGAIVRAMWRGLPATGAVEPSLRPVTLRLRQMVGKVTHEGQIWAEGDALSVPVPVTFGREPGNTVKLEDPFVSSCHAELTHDGTALWLTDRGSKNGTWLGQKRIDRPARLEPKAEFRIGGTVIRFEE